VAEWASLKVVGGASAALDAVAAVELRFATDVPRVIVEGLAVSGTAAGAGLVISAIDGLDAGFVQLSDVQVGVDAEEVDQTTADDFVVVNEENRDHEGNDNRRIVTEVAVCPGSVPRCPEARSARPAPLQSRDVDPPGWC
jgi:hypothetical protein